jgi:uncharacterized membrane protein
MAMASHPSSPPIDRSRISVPGNSGVKITRARTIRKSAQQLYEFWRDFRNLPQIIKHPVRITVLSETESEWSVSAPFTDSEVTWRATIISDKPGEVIAWRSIEGAEIPNAGSVRFDPAPGDEGTEVTVSLEYAPPGGKLGGLIAKLSPDEPGRQTMAALRRFKALMEAGEIPTIEGQPVGEPQRSKQQ